VRAHPQKELITRFMEILLSQYFTLLSDGGESLAAICRNSSTW
jgi:hypothetical protein